jgi:hypothetical protein
MWPPTGRLRLCSTWAQMPAVERLQCVHDLLDQVIQATAALDMADPDHAGSMPVARPLRSELDQGRALTGPGPWSPNPVAFATMLADCRLLAAEDHLRGLRAVLADGSATLAALSMSRAVLEAAARAWWLLDPGIDARTRVARGMTDRLAELRQMIRSGDHLPGPSAKAAARQQAAILAGAHQHGFPVSARKGVVGNGSPTSSELVRRMLCGPGRPGGQLGRLVYAELSAAVHSQLEGRTWRRGWQLLGRLPSLDDDAVRVLGWAAGCAVAGYSEARSRHSRLYGLDHGRWERAARAPQDALTLVLLLSVLQQRPRRRPGRSPTQAHGGRSSARWP